MKYVRRDVLVDAFLTVVQNGLIASGKVHVTSVRFLMNELEELVAEDVFDVQKFKARLKREQHFVHRATFHKALLGVPGADERHVSS